MKEGRRFPLSAGWLFLFCLGFLGIPGCAEGGLDEWLSARWTIESGLPQNTVRALCRTADGYLWLGTRSGLVRFDGVRFQIFNRWNSPRMPSEEVLSLLGCGDQGIWVGTTAGLSLFNGKSWSLPRLPGAINCLAAGRDGSVWAGTPRGVYLLDADGIAGSRGHWLPDQEIIRLVAEKEGSVLAGVRMGAVWRLAPGTSADTLRTAVVPGEINDILPWRGGMWIASKSGLFRIAGESGRAERVSLPGSAVPNSLLESRDGGLWIGTTDRGILYLDHRGAPGGFHPGLEGNSVLSLYRDARNNLWAGTEVSGLVRLRRRAVRGMVRDRGPVTAVMGLGDGTAWAATRDRGLIRFSPAGEEEKPEVHIPLQALSLARKGRTAWLGTAGAGLVRLDLSGLERIRVPFSEKLSIRAVLPGPGEESWLATDRGLLKGSGKDFESVPLPGTGVEGEAISVLLPGDSGEIWAGGDSGVWRFSDGEWTAVTGNEDFPAPRSVASLYRDGQGLLWAGTRGWGLFVRFRDRWIQMDTSRGLADNYILGIQQDDRGYLWCGCHRGVFRIVTKDFASLTAGPDTRVDCLVWNEGEGMPSSECTGEAQPSAWKTATGTLLFPTVRGVAVVDPGMAAESAADVPVHIEAVLADSRSLDPGTPARLGRNVEMLEFYFTYPELAAPGKVIFRYRLKGFRDQWTITRPGQERSALYLNLGPGKYEFQVQARGGEGIWSPGIQSYALRISGRSWLPFLWATLILMAAAGGVWVVGRKKSSVNLPKYRTSGLTDDVARQKLKDLLEVMQSERPYLEADLTLGKLAERVGIHQNYLSRIINEHREQSFNDFVNQYRIEEACRRLLSPADKDLTILQIAYETGFYSKSVFNSAFKKFTGQTPSEFRRNPPVID